MEISDLKPGREMDYFVAVEFFKQKAVLQKHIEHHDMEVEPIFEDNNRPVPLYSTTPEGANLIEEYLKKEGWEIKLDNVHGKLSLTIENDEKVHDVQGGSLPELLCIAALKSVRE